jgi:MerR family mercuric resistance operon transcriptional regulator
MMPRPPRTASGRRVYGEMEARSLAFIRRARELGFSLDEIRTLLALAAEGGHQACVEVRDLAARHLADVRAKIVDLKVMEGVLADAVEPCDQGEPTDCPLIDSLSSTTRNTLQS